MLDRALDLEPHGVELAIGGLQLREAPEPPRHVVHPGLRVLRRLVGRHLEQRQLVVLLAEAQEHHAALQVLVGDLQAQRLRVEVSRLLGVADLQDDVAEPLCLDHWSPPAGSG